MPGIIFTDQVKMIQMSVILMTKFSSMVRYASMAAFALVVALCLSTGVAYADELNTPAVDQGSVASPDNGVSSTETTEKEAATGSDVAEDEASNNSAASSDPAPSQDEGKALTNPSTSDVQPSTEVQYKEGLVSDKTGLRYQNSDGTFAQGWKTVSDNKYYFGANGYAVKYEQDIDGNRYYFDWDYHMVTGWVTWNADKTRSYFGDDGAALSGWQEIGGKRYYFDPANQFHGKRWESTIDGKFYYFDSDCSMVTGWVTWYADKSKTLFGVDGVMVDGGWQTWKGKKYYIDPVTHRAVKWEQTIDGKQYYFDSDCSMYVGLITWGKDGTKSFYGSDGVMASGWQNWKGKTYYINPSTMRAVKWEQTINGQFYYFDDNCAMYNKGWLRWGADGSWSYFPSNGIRYTGWHTIDGVSYNFGSNGKCTTYNPFISDMAGRAQGYWSGTGYLIMVDRSTHRVGIFSGSRYNWRAVKWFSCVTGAWSTPTITGSYQTTGYKKPCLSTDSRARYATQIYGGYFFHTILASNNELGQNLSHGCIRLAVPDAQWIYNNIGGGTRVVIYN